MSDNDYLVRVEVYIKAAPDADHAVAWVKENFSDHSPRPGTQHPVTLLSVYPLHPTS